MTCRIGQCRLKQACIVHKSRRSERCSCAALWGNLNRRNAKLVREGCDEAQQRQLQSPAFEKKLHVPAYAGDLCSWQAAFQSSLGACWTVSWAWASNTGLLWKLPTVSSALFRSLLREAQGNLSFLYPQCCWGHMYGVQSPVLGCPAQTSCGQTVAAPAQAQKSCSEMVLQHAQEAIPVTATSLQWPPAACSQPPCARDGCYPAQGQQGWPAASHCRANEGVSYPCSLLLAAPWAHKGSSLPRWQIKWEWQLFSRFYSAVDSWPGVEGEGVKCGF